MRTLFLHACEINLYSDDFLVVDAPFRQNLPCRVTKETLSPKFDARAAGRGFVADAVDGGDVATVGNRVAALDRFPRTVLPVAVLFLFTGMPADGRRVKEELRAAKRRQPRGLGEPLVPAYAARRACPFVYSTI